MYEKLKNNVKHFYTDDWSSYSKYIPPEKHQIGKKNTWKIERKNLNFRTHLKRLARRTICFSKSEIVARYRKQNWEELIDRDDFGIITKCKDLENLEILVLGINAERSAPKIDEEILPYLWRKWFDEMGVKEDNYKIFTSVPPTELKADIESFLKGK